MPIVRKFEFDAEIAYIPGHAGIRYNVRADRLAGRAEAFGDLVPTPADIITRISEKLLADREQLQGTWTLQRLIEKDIRQGEGATLQLRGPQRKLWNQLLFGTITQNSLEVLLEMLEGRGPRYLPEPLLSW